MAKKDEATMLSVKQVAEQIGAGVSSVRLWAQQGRFPGAELKTSPAGDYWLIPETALGGFEKRGRGRPQKPLSELKSKPRRKA
jgi:hypothetical protein